ncbi:MAG: ADP-forming succinate--CoA ligase subunit beta [Candidatus Sericytochromatia bacterium]|nr:ADP-forming succinate--CoA ligase subunit beta [Candidatus Tanganyikabacteria bacterium]
MKIHEYQAKQVLAKFGVPVPEGRVATSPDQVKSIAEEFRNGPVVVKAQVHVGGRGKAGGIKLAKSPAEAEEAAKQILGMSLKGLVVRKVLVESGLAIDREYYLGMILDRDSKRIVVMVSSEGGVDIEEVAAVSPEKIAKITINPTLGLADYQIRYLCFAGGIDKSLVKEVAKFLKALYRAFLESDASLAEINPLVVTKEGRLIAADAKINIDDNALFRQPDLAAWQESEEDNPIEEEARKRGLTYVSLDGDIGIIGNGAGLVMTSLDVVAREGGKPANFLDIGGGAKAEVVRNALEVVLLKPDVKGVVINIFGGITRCDEVAKGIIEAARTLQVEVPVVVRLEGTSVEEGKRILAESGLNLVPAATMREAARRIVELSYAA